MDKYYTYRPMLDLIGRSEGTDKGRGYNETLAYGALTGGNVDLVNMTLAKVDLLQGEMLRHPANKWNSSALGRYQIVRKTRRAIEEQLGISAAAHKFDVGMQDRMACYLLGQRGIDKWLSGRMSTDTLLLNLAKEWASLPTPAGVGFYGGQKAAVTVSMVNAALMMVRARHKEGQPATEVLPEEVEQEAVKAERRNWWQWLTVLPLTGVGAFFRDYPELSWAAVGGVVVVAIVAMVGGRNLVRRVKEIAEEVRT